MNMTRTNAIKVGYKQAFKAITFGLVIAYFIMSLLAGPFWLFRRDYMPTILFAVAMLYLSGFYLGGLMGKWIINKRRSPIFLGIIAGFMIVWIATFLGSLIGFFNEGLRYSNSLRDSFYNYIYKPLALVTVFGFIPIILVGIWFGLSVKSLGSKITSDK